MKEPMELIMEYNYLEEILNNAVSSLYKSLPDGKENYGKNSRIGEVHISNSSCPEPGCSHILYWPSKHLTEFKDKGCSQRGLGKINLENKTYTLWKEDGFTKMLPSIPKRLIEDTEKVMGLLGLIKKEDV